MGSSDTLRARPEEERSLNSRAAATSFLTSSNAPLSSRASSGVGVGGVRAGERRGWRVRGAGGQKNGADCGAVVKNVVKKVVEMVVSISIDSLSFSKEPQRFIDNVDFCARNPLLDIVSQYISLSLSLSLISFE